MNEAQAKAAWERAREATQEARTGVIEARTQLKWAESSLTKAWDAERLCWIALQASKANTVAIEWPKERGKRRRKTPADCE